MGKHALDMPRNGEIDQMTNEELQTTLAQLRSVYMTDKADTTRGGNPPTGRMRETRRTVARILTTMRKRGVSPRGNSLVSSLPPQETPAMTH